MRLRLTLITTLIVLAVYVVFAGALFAAQMHSAFRSIDTDLRDASSALAAAGPASATADRDQRVPGRRGDRGARSRLREAASQPDLVAFFGRDGTSRLDGPDGDEVTPDDASVEIARRGAGDHTWTDRVDGVPFRLHAQGFPGGAVVVGAPVTQIVGQQRRLGGLLIGGGLVVAALVAGATALTAGWALKPIRRMRETAEAVTATEDPSLRVPVPERDDEVGRLARAFDAMLVRLRGAQQRAHDALETQRHFLADASHELRTPVTSLRGNLDLLSRHPDIDPAEREQMIEEMRVEATRLGGLVEDVLDLSRVGGDSVRSGAWVIPAEIAGAVAAATRRRSDAAGRDVVVVDETRASYVWTDAEVLRRVLDALVDNAVVHGRGRISMRVGLDAAGAVRVEVCDEGDGVAADERDRVFERFARGADAHGRAGSGLGLSIAAALCEQIGATLGLDDDDPSTFVISLPTGHGDS